MVHGLMAGKPAHSTGSVTARQ